MAHKLVDASKYVDPLDDQEIDEYWMVQATNKTTGLVFNKFRLQLQNQILSTTETTATTRLHYSSNNSSRLQEQLHT